MVFKRARCLLAASRHALCGRFQHTVSTVGLLHLYLVYFFICSLLPQLDFVGLSSLFVLTMSSVRGLREKLLSTVF